VISVLMSYVSRGALRPVPPGGHLMLDSGAFTAMRTGEPPTVKTLAAWYAATPAERYAALDVIYDPAASRLNALAMRELGADVIPAVHAGTDPAEIDRLAADGFRAVALGGLVPRWQNRVDKRAWMHTCLDRAAALGMPVHGFGFSPGRELPLLLRFASVDATNWHEARFGHLYVWTGGGIRYLKDIHRQRLEMADLVRRWPGDLTARLAFGHSVKGESYQALVAISAASLLAWGEWLMARGGPRVYLAAYQDVAKPATDALVVELFEYLAPEATRLEGSTP
jgi:hypothetical protein